MKALSEKQKRILDFIRHFLEEKSYPPTVRDIVKGCGLSSTSVADYNLRILEREGHLRRDREVSRGIELEERHRIRPRRVPLLGRIAAGQPVPVPAPDAWSNLASAEVLEVPAGLVGNREDVYALEVKGNSMVDALIGDGDIVLLAPAASVENGQMVAVWLKKEGEVTLKRIYQEGERIRLQPANVQMEPIYTSQENVEVQGRVVGVFRRLG